MFLFSLITQQNNAAIIFEIEYVAHMLKRAFWYIILFLLTPEFALKPLYQICYVVHKRINIFIKFPVSYSSAQISLCDFLLKYVTLLLS